MMPPSGQNTVISREKGADQNRTGVSVVTPDSDCSMRLEIASRRRVAWLLVVLAFALLVVSPAGGAFSAGTVSGSESAYRAASLRAIRQVFGARAPAAIRVARCETGGTFDPRAVGRAGERGIFQIHPVHFGWAQPRRLFDPVWNSRVAYRLSRGGRDWRPWSCGWAA